MRKIRIIEQISLDGVIQAPGGRNEGGDDYAHGGWTAPYRSAAGGEAVAEAQGNSFDLLQAEESAAVDDDSGGARAFGTNPLVQGFARIASVAELRDLTPQDCLARWLEGQAKDPAQYEDQRGPIRTRTIVGEVVESDTQAHIVYRINTDVGRYGLTEETAVITVRRGTNGWALLLNAEISIMGSVRTITVAPDTNDGEALSN